MGRLSNQITAAQVSLSNLPEQTKLITSLTPTSIDTALLINYFEIQAKKDSAGNYLVSGACRFRASSVPYSVEQWSVLYIPGVTAIDGAAHAASLGHTGWNFYGTTAMQAYVDGTGGALRLQLKASASLDWHLGSEYISVSFSDVPVASKPTWFDANREDGFNVSAQIEHATSTSAGLVKADRFYQTALTGDVYGGVCATVSNLVVGRRYIATVSAVGRADSGAGVGNFSVVHDSGTLIGIAVNYTATSLDLPASGSIQFVATATSVTLEVNAGTASGVRSRGGNIQLLELNSTEYGAF